MPYNDFRMSHISPPAHKNGKPVRGLFFFVFFFCTGASFSQTDLPAAEKRQRFIDYSMTYLGVPYKYGGMSKSGMDCSGFICTAAVNSIGLQLPRTVNAIYSFAELIPDEELQPGDIVFFQTVGNRPSHAGIYLGNNQFIHSASDGPNTGVIISNLNENYWKRTYIGGGRVLPPAGGMSAKSGTAGTAAGTAQTEARQTSADRAQQRSVHKQLSLALEASGTFMWNIQAKGSEFLGIRGGSLDLHAEYTGWNTRPGVGISFRFDTGMKAIQIPLTFSLTTPYRFRAYFGAVFMPQKPELPDSGGKKLTVSTFPGIIGFAWQTPSLAIGPVGLSLFQDVSCILYTDTDKNKLSFADSMRNGFMLSTGVRLTFSL